MRFNNLRKGILYYIGDATVLRREEAPVSSSRIYEEYADIPQKDVQDALFSLEDKDLVSLSGDAADISLTGKGLHEFKRSCLNQGRGSR